MLSISFKNVWERNGARISRVTVRVKQTRTEGLGVDIIDQQRERLVPRGIEIVVDGARPHHAAIPDGQLQEQECSGLQRALVGHR